MKFATAVLIGIVSADVRHDRPIWTLQSVQDHRTDATLQHDFEAHATAAANARPPYRSHVQEASSSSDSSSSDDDEEKVQVKAAEAESSDDDDDTDEDIQIGDDEVDHSGEFFKVTEAGKLGGGGYERVTTPRFAADSDDIFMRSMVEQYALEGKNKDGSPNGQFWMDEAAARSAASEVLHTHRGLTGKAREAYLKTYFPRTWAHFDVNRSGKVEAIKMPQLIRFLASDQQMYLW